MAQDSLGKQGPFRRLNHCVYSLHYHLVLATKYRRKCLTGAMLDRLRNISADRCAGWGGELVEFNGERDHVHLLVALPPNLDLSRFVINLKATSSRHLRKEFMDELRNHYWRPVLWRRSCCIISCGGAPLSVIRQYIEQQERPG